VDLDDLQQLSAALCGLSKSFERMPLDAGTERTITALNGRWQRPIRMVGKLAKFIVFKGE
jgi:hypothetical protein